MDRAKGCTPSVARNILHRHGGSWLDSRTEAESFETSAALWNECPGKRDRLSQFLSSNCGPLTLLGNFPFLSGCVVLVGGGRVLDFLAGISTIPALRDGIDSFERSSKTFEFGTIRFERLLIWVSTIYLILLSGLMHLWISLEKKIFTYNSYPYGICVLLNIFNIKISIKNIEVKKLPFIHFTKNYLNF